MKILPICYVSSRAIDSPEKASSEIFKFYNSAEFFKFYGHYLIIVRKQDHLVKNLQSKPKYFEKIFHRLEMNFIENF